MVSTMPPADHFRADGSSHLRRLSSAGGPRRWSRGDHGRRGPTAAAQGDRGEICVRGSLVMAGYYKNPTATAEASPNGWHHTGDIGYLDDDGYLHIVDRAKDMIISGGFNVYSAEVEQALMAHPTVRTAPSSVSPTTNGASGSRRWSSSIAGATRERGGAGRLRQGTHRHGEGAQAGRRLAPTCRARRSARSSRPKSSRPCVRERSMSRWTGSVVPDLEPSDIPI